MPTIDRPPLLHFAFLGSLLLTFFIGTSLVCAQPSPLSTEGVELPHFKPLSFNLVDDANNEADSETGFGAVATTFEMGTYQITAAQYALFLNAVASEENGYGLYDARMSNDPDVACIAYHPDELPHYSAMIGREDFPITYVDLFCAVRFCNWMSHGSPIIDSTTRGISNTAAITETGAYIIHSDQDSEGNIMQWIEATAEAPFFIPDEDQWYKAAYYHHDTGKIISYDPESPIPSVQDQGSFKYWNYPTQSMGAPLNSQPDFYDNIAANYFNEESSSWSGPSYSTDTFSYCNFSYLHDGAYLTPVGKFKSSPGPYGTFDMGGNVNEWTFSDDAGANPDKPLCTIRGGSWQSTSADLNRQARHAIRATTKNSTTGFRIAHQASPGEAEPKYDLTNAIIENAAQASETQISGSLTVFLELPETFAEMTAKIVADKAASNGIKAILRNVRGGLLTTIPQYLLFDHTMTEQDKLRYEGLWLLVLFLHP